MSKKSRDSYNKSTSVYSDQGVTEGSHVHVTEGPRSILQKAVKQHAHPTASVYPVIHRGEDVTPVALDPFAFEGTKERQLNVQVGLDASTLVSTLTQRAQSQQFRAEVLQQRQETETVNLRSYISQYVDDVYIERDTSEGVSSASWEAAAKILDEENDDSGSVCAMGTQKIPTHISLILVETETQFLLDLPSATEVKGTPEGDAVEEANKTYEYLTRGKGRNRKVLNVQVQTVPQLLKTRDTETAAVHRKDGEAFASVWDMYDTYEMLDAGMVTQPKTFQEESDDEIEELHKLNSLDSLQNMRYDHDEKQMAKLLKNPRFLDAVLVVERLLANNSYNEEQKRYKSLMDREDDNFREDKECKYTLRHLWSYATEETSGLCVTDLAWSTTNDDILAAAYGKFFFGDNRGGAVLLWNMKNPQTPERFYRFSGSVSTISFSKTKVNSGILAVGFHDGRIRLLDVRSRELKVLREARTVFEPMFKVLWHKADDHSDEHIMACFGGGYVFRYEMDDSSELKTVQIMRTSKVEGKLHGFGEHRECKKKQIGVNTYADATALTLHPVDPFIYYVGTSEGVIHKCSTNYLNQHLEVFKAHTGIIHQILFSPFANKLFNTVGSDFRVKCWAEGIIEPLWDRDYMTAVDDASWSPSHSTIMVSARGVNVYLWDVQKRALNPQSVTRNPHGIKNHACIFTRNGKGLIVGDVDGNTAVYALEDMPFPAFFQVDHLWQCLQRQMVTEPELLSKLTKLDGLKYKDYSEKLFTT